MKKFKQTCKKILIGVGFALALVIVLGEISQYVSGEDIKLYYRHPTVQFALADYDSGYAEKCVESVQNKTPEYYNRKEALILKSGQRSYDRGRTAQFYKQVCAYEENPVNGYIDYAVCQGLSADCWLLGPVMALSEKASGAEILHDAMRINEAGNLEVWLRGPNRTYEITAEEMTHIKNGGYYFSVGDNDMLAFEIAVQRFREEVAAGGIVIDPDLPENLYSTGDEWKFDMMQMGETPQAYWLLTGIVSEDAVEGEDQEKIQELLQQYRKNPENTILDMSFQKRTATTDIHGNPVSIIPSHEYWVTSLNENTITLCETRYCDIPVELNLENFGELPLQEMIHISLK